jgi:dipeptidyl-peptidase-4
MFAKFSPDGTRVAYVRQNNIYVERVDSGAIVQLTTDGTPVPGGAAWAPATAGTIVNGTSDWVNEEELDIRDGFRWSPDGRRIAYWQFDTAGVGNYTLINDTASQYPTTTVFAYPKPGTTNSAVRIGVVAVDGGATTWIKTPGDPRNTYLASLEWIDPATVAMQQLNRLQTENDYLLGDASSGAVTRAFHDAAVAPKPGGWVDIQSDVTCIDGRRAFLWLSERDGWKHVYHVGGDGKVIRQVTRGEWEARTLHGADERAGWVYFSGTERSHIGGDVYRVQLDGSRVAQSFGRFSRQKVDPR